MDSAGFRVEIREGYAASEEMFKQTGRGGPSPSIIHVSTHGFFLADQKRDERRPISGGELFGSGGSPRDVENPMLCSGLVFAGANEALLQGRPPEGLDDGILTAYDVARMDLRNTDLVVLSACETGLGEVNGSEGVFGLQRAFRLAGAQALLMSLWQVPERATTELLTRFYQNWLVAKMPRRAALEEAQKWMRGRSGYSSPFYWAGFVLLE